jgi:hypothetical protein
VELSALTGARVFLGRPYSHAAGSREVAEIAAARLAFTEQVLRAPTWALAANDLRQAGVDWWVAATPESRPWDPEGAQAIHVSGDVFIYATQEGATVEVGQGDL